MSQYLTSLFSLSGKTAIVTGSTGGLGLAMTLALANAGADIVSIMLADDPRADVLAEGVQKAGRQLRVFNADVADSQKLRETFGKMWEAGIAPDILLNCAGINRRGKVEDLTDEEIDEVFAINLKGSDAAAQEVGRRLLQLNRPGKIINVASIISFVATVNISAYAATKGGVLQMTKAMSNEWEVKASRSTVYVREPYTRDKVVNDHIIGRTPTGRWGLPDDFQGAVVFLASSASNFVTGTSRVVDGGLLAR